jgi:pimeloyl-ACP methyl ester carboxylesterase
VRVDEHTITLGQAPVFYRSAASSGTPALYLHGIPTSSDDWTGCLERTGGIAPDLPGFGRTGKAGHLDYSLAGHADFIERLLDVLDAPRVQLVAHDWGAGGGLVFAQRHPDRVERLVLCNALPLLSGFHWHRLARVLRRPLLGELVMGSTTRWLLARTLRRGCVRADAWPEAAIASIWQQFDQGTQRAILRLYRSAEEPRLATAGADLETLGVPALVLWGEQDPWFDVAFAEAYGGRLRGAEVRPIAGAGHWPWLDQPSVVDQLAAFLGS